VAVSVNIALRPTISSEKGEWLDSDVDVPVGHGPFGEILRDTHLNVGNNDEIAVAGQFAATESAFGIALRLALRGFELLSRLFFRRGNLPFREDRSV
jgi:hypothetical protein